MHSYQKAGVCPRCDGVHTEIRIWDGDDWRVMAKCNDCGYEDMVLVGDDLELLVQEAKSSFSTIIMSDDGGRSKGMPTAEDIAHDVSILIKAMCDRLDCSECPLHKTGGWVGDDKFCEGWLVENSKLGLRCRDQDAPSCKASLARKFIGMS